MQSRKLFDNKKSYIAISKGKMFIVDSNTKSYYPLAIRITEGFQVELGRNISDIIEALKYTRLPIIIKRIPLLSDTISNYQVIRMHTGKVDDKIIANISTVDGKIKSISFNRELITDKDYRRYNQLSILHQLSISDAKKGNGGEVSRAYRIEQVRNALKNVIVPGAKNVNITEDNDQIIFNIHIYSNVLKFVFIHNKEKKSFDLVSITVM